MVMSNWILLNVVRNYITIELTIIFRVSFGKFGGSTSNCNECREMYDANKSLLFEIITCFFYNINQ